MLRCLFRCRPRPTIGPSLRQLDAVCAGTSEPHLACYLPRCHWAADFRGHSLRSWTTLYLDPYPWRCQLGRQFSDLACLKERSTRVFQTCLSSKLQRARYFFLRKRNTLLPFTRNAEVCRMQWASYGRKRKRPAYHRDHTGTKIYPSTISRAESSGWYFSGIAKVLV